MSTRIVPPLRRDWKEGKMQIGLFIRTQEGSTIQCVTNDASPDAIAKVGHLFAAMIDGETSKPK